MPDPVEPEVQEPEIKEEPKGLDPTRSLSSQTKEIEALMPKEEDVKPEEKKPEQTPPPAKEEPEKEEPETPSPSGEDSEEEEQEVSTPEVEAKELPTWQKYILDNLPEIQTVGHVGKGKDKVFNIKRVEDLPEGFEFSDKRAELAFSAALASQEVNARELLNRYRQEEQQQQYREFQEKEAIDIQSDIQRLQKEGIIQKFEYAEDDPKFNDDPAVKEANAIYDLYKKTNDAYVKEGRTYRISYEDAAYKYLGMKSRQTAKPEVQKEREQIASKVSAPSSSPPEGDKRTMPPGSTMADVRRLYSLGRI